MLRQPSSTWGLPLFLLLRQMMTTQPSLCPVGRAKRFWQLHRWRKVLTWRFCEVSAMEKLLIPLSSPSCSSPCPHPTPPTPGRPSLAPPVWALHRCPQHGICPSQDLVLVGIQSEKFDLESVDRVDHGHQGDSGESPGGELEAAGAGQLDGQSLEKELGQVLAQTGPYASSKGEVVEPAVLVFTPTLAKAVRVEDVHILEDRSSVMGVPDAVHHAPAFGDLETLQKKGRGGEKTKASQTCCKGRGSRRTR